MIQTSVRDHSTATRSRINLVPAVRLASYGSHFANDEHVWCHKTVGIHVHCLQNLLTSWRISRAQVKQSSLGNRDLVWHRYVLSYVCQSIALKVRCAEGKALAEAVLSISQSTLNQRRRKSTVRYRLIHLVTLYSRTLTRPRKTG